MVWEHEREIWEKYYPKGSPILDIGADPESVRFFQNRGQQVIPIGDSFGSHIGAIKIDIDGSELGMVLETHGPMKWKHLYTFPGTQTCIWRLERSGWHQRRIRLAHWLKLKIETVTDKLMGKYDPDSN
jgi:hypothetical protein